jgi:predicted nuclease of predicted toxin-antitoxin system
VRFLIDANLPRSLAELVSKLGHEARFAHDIGLGTAPDKEIAAYAQKTGAAILTRDLDFADVRQYPPEHYSGIVVLRVPDDAIAPYIVEVAGRFVRQQHFISQLSGRLAIVERDRVRFRPPLP